LHGSPALVASLAPLRSREERGASALDTLDLEDDPAVAVAVEGPRPPIGNNPRLPMDRIATDKATACAGVASAND
jgi:hypothetical protein